MKNNVVDIWQETFPVRFGAIDKSDRLTLDGIFNYFQEAAISHAENLSVGRRDMAQAGQVWILSRMSVVVDRRPGYCETVTVRSWPRGSEKLFAIRDYDIRDKDNVPVVKGRSCWIIIDIEKRRPLRPQSLMHKMPLNENENALAYIPAALEEHPGLQAVECSAAAERKALYTDVDYVGHVNNVRYIQWIEDSINPKLLEEADKICFDINYMNEILGDEVVTIMSAKIEDKKAVSAFAFEGRKKESGQKAFRAELRLF